MDDVSCNRCLSPIPRGASVCAVCQSYQGFVRYNLSFVNSGVAVVVALASLATSIYGLKIVGAHAHTPRSDIRLTAPQVHDGFVTLNAINVGDAPGSLRAVTIESPVLGGILPLTSASADDEFVPVGAKRVTFRFKEQLSLEAERRAREQVGLTQSNDENAGTINIMIVGSDGSEKFADVPVPIGRFIALESDRMNAAGDSEEETSGNSSEP